MGFKPTLVLSREITVGELSIRQETGSAGARTWPA
jgi:hypothetical protein